MRMTSRFSEFRRKSAFLLIITMTLFQACSGTSWQEDLQQGKRIRGDSAVPAEQRFAEAKELYSRALRKLKSVLPDSNIELKEIRELFNEYESLLRTIREYDELVEVIEDRVAIFQEYAGANTMLTCTAHFNLGAAYEKVGRTENAIEQFTKARVIYQSLGRTVSADKMMDRIRTLRGKTEVTSTQHMAEERAVIPKASESSPVTVALPTTGYNRFALPPDIVALAVAYGKSASYDLDEFGSPDFGINKLSLGQEVGYVTVKTPFLQVALQAYSCARNKKHCSPEEVQQALQRPVEIKVVLFPSPELVKEEIACIVEADELKIDLTNNKMEASFCDEAAGECVRAITYIVLAKRMAGKTTFTLVLQSASLGEKRLEIKVNELQ